MGVDPDFAIGANDTPVRDREPPRPGLDDAEADRRRRRRTPASSATAWATASGPTEVADAPRRHGHRVDRHHHRRTATRPRTSTGCRRITSFATEAAWNASPDKAALDVHPELREDPDGGGLRVEGRPRDRSARATTGGKLRNPVTLSDDVAREARRPTILGFNKNTPSQVCAECHAPNEPTLRDWQEKTNERVETLPQGRGRDGRSRQRRPAPARASTNASSSSLGPYEVAAGSFFEVTIAGTGDVDLYVKRGEEPSKTVYDCRPFTQTSTEECDKTHVQRGRSGDVLRRLYGDAGRHGEGHRQVHEAAPRTRSPRRIASTASASSRANTDSPFTPAKLGIYSAAAHLGWFQDTFKAAFPAGEIGNTADTWALEYGKFKNRVSMPKGNHPRLDQAQFDIVAEWFARGLPRLTSYIAPDTGPTIVHAEHQAGDGDARRPQMATQGWGALNRQANLNMYGCTGSDPRSCLTAHADRAVASRTAPAGRRPERSACSASSRSTPSTGCARRPTVASSPTAAPVVSRSSPISRPTRTSRSTRRTTRASSPTTAAGCSRARRSAPAFCKTSLLVVEPRRSINFSESACSSVSTVSLYQHLGAGLGGGDYFAVNSQFTSRQPVGRRATADPSAAFAEHGRDEVHADDVRRHALRRQDARSRSRARTRVTACSRRRRSSSSAASATSRRTSATCVRKINARPERRAATTSPPPRSAATALRVRSRRSASTRSTSSRTTTSARTTGRTSASRRRATRRSRRCSRRAPRTSSSSTW